MRYEGLTNSEIEYLTTPLAELDKTGIALAISAFDNHVNLIRERNKTFVPEFSARTPYIITDDLGVQGVLNHANGKVYDSKSKYYADLKASGHVIVESGMSTDKKGDYDARKDVAKALNQLGY